MSNKILAQPVTSQSDLSRSEQPRCCSSNDAGGAFGDVINLSNSANATSDDPAIAAEGENVYVTFWDDKTGPRKPFVVASNDAGETFRNPIMLNATATSNTT